MIVAFLLLSCAKQPEPVVEQPLPFSFDENLLLVDSLMQSDADSALRILLSMDKACLAANANNHYHSLLLSEALYKTYNPQLNRYRNETFREASLHDAVHYFDSVYSIYPTNDDLAMLSARSHYMNGVGYYENDSVVEACKEYLHTLEIVEDHFDVDKLNGYKAKFMALIYGRLIEIFSNQNMMAPTIDCCKKALYFGKIEPTSKYGVSKSLLLIGRQYDIMKELDSASYYYNLALSELPDFANQTYRSIVASLSILNYQLGFDANTSIDSLQNLVLSCVNKDERLSLYLGIGYIYYEEKLYDSANYYLDNVYKYKKDIISKIQSAEFLKNINLIVGNKEKVDEYTHFLSDNAIKVYEKTAEVSELDNIFHKYQQNRKDKRIHIEKYRIKIRLISIIMPIVVIIVLVVFLTTQKRSKREIAIHKLALKKTEGTLSDIKMKIEIKQFINDPVCNNILKIVKEQNFKSKIDYINYKDFALGKDQIVALRETANLHYDNFTIRLKEQFPELTDDDINYCCLYLLGLKDADVAALMQKEYSNICRRNRKIRSILGSEKNLTEALYNLACLRLTNCLTTY